MSLRTGLFFVAVSLQTGLLLSIPFAPLLAGIAGNESPVIRLAIALDDGARPEALTYFNPEFVITRPDAVPGWETLSAQTAICVVLTPGGGGFHEVESVHTVWPLRTPRHAVILTGYTTGRGLVLQGLGTYHLGPGMRIETDDAPRQPHAEVSVTKKGRGRIEAIIFDGRRH